LGVHARHARAQWLFPKTAATNQPRATPTPWFAKSKSAATLQGNGATNPPNGTDQTAPSSRNGPVIHRELAVAVFQIPRALYPDDRIWDMFAPKGLPAGDSPAVGAEASGKLADAYFARFRGAR
jgi:hypothetical protein